MARGGERVLVDVGAVDLDLEFLRPLPEVLREQNRQRVRLLARRAAGTPDADGPRLAGFSHDPRDDLAIEHRPRLRIAEESGDVDEDRVEEGDVLFGMLLEVAGVGREAVRVHLAHASLDPADERGRLVLAKVEVVARAQRLQEVLEPGVALRGRFRCRVAVTHRGRTPGARSVAWGRGRRAQGRSW